ncbi:hypothetical protein K3172_12795 [Qipengyuania sp. 6B39]|uniref:hypothetical protein n=1 Tax=Qipengyuania proteolytica TaxID=2867239 RepID=UPI001C88E7A3|nr:hypothetical protein [Qipengyuania proteolytica]MBX7496736.1 hypothetical protein [Qipengyuania proteolytica]
MSGPALQEARRGQPVLFLGLLLAGWVLLRIVLWESPWQVVARPFQVAEFTGPETLAPAADGTAAFAKTVPSDARSLPHAAERYSPAYGDLNSPAPPAHMMAEPSANGSTPFASDRRALGHSLLWMAGMGELPMPRDVADWLDPRLSPAVVPAGLARAKPWRVDAWLLLRQGSAGRLAGSGVQPASYGASQAGAVMTYRLAPNSRHQPSAYFRASKALVADGEAELAMGLQGRPVGGLPIAVHAEMRTTRSVTGTTVRPAVFATAGIDQASLPLGLQAEGYGQGGYVGGDFATGFADGRVTVTRDVTRRDSFSFSAGAGAWGGIQLGASRLDVGPTLRVDLTIGETPARLSADYRFRVAGDAEPASGAAITLSTGF